MSDTDQSYYQPAKGTIAGFSGIDLPGDDPTLARSGFSVEQIRRFLMNESGTNFPTVERVDEIEEQILRHIADTNNPHGVSATAITQDVSEQILVNFVAGTPPSSTPFFAYDAASPVPLGSIFPAQYNAINFYRMLDGGRMVDTSNDPDRLGVDSTNGSAGLPLYSNFVNLVPNNWFSLSSLPLNTRVTKTPNETYGYPFDFYRVDETSATGEFGINLSASMISSNVYTATFFLKPLYVTGYIVVKQSGSDAAAMLINASTGEFVLASSTVQGDVVVYPSGVMKVSYSFVATTSGVNRVQVLHRKDVVADPTRVGSMNRPIFLIASPLISTSPIGSPIPANPAASATIEQFAPNLDALGVPGTLSRAMISMTVMFRKQLAALPLTDTVLWQIDGLLLIRDISNVYLELNGTRLFQAPLVNGLNDFAVSYSPTEIIFKSGTTARQVITGTYSALSSAKVRVGPCAGHLKQFSMYPENDRYKCLEFLTNG